MSASIARAVLGLSLVASFLALAAAPAAAQGLPQFVTTYWFQYRLVGSNQAWTQSGPHRTLAEANTRIRFYVEHRYEVRMKPDGSGPLITQRVQSRVLPIQQRGLPPGVEEDFRIRMTPHRLSVRAIYASSEPREVPIAGARVTLSNAATGATLAAAYTDAGGNVAFPEVRSGQYTITIARYGFYTARQPHTMPAQDSHATIALERYYVVQP